MHFKILLLVVAFAALASGQKLERKMRRVTNCNDLARSAKGDKVTVHYTGRLRSSRGRVFDSSDGGEPIAFVLGEGHVIEGWDRGLEGICEGDKMDLIIPAHLGYGAEGAGDGIIPPNTQLFFTMSLEKLEKQFGVEPIKPKDCPKDKRTRNNDKISLHYIGRLVETGDIFDSSYERNEPVEMTIGKTGVAGWDRGAAGMCPGEVRRVFVPAEMGYGEEGIPGTIPPNADFILEIELVDVKDRVLSFLDRISSGTFNTGK